MLTDILGLGCDILEVERLEHVLCKKRNVFIKRVLTPSEKLEYERRVSSSLHRGNSYLATRYCAKEAFSKALGSGLGKLFSFQDLSVMNEQSGRPILIYSERLTSWLDSKRAFAHVSLSDERKYAMATVIIYSKQ